MTNNCETNVEVTSSIENNILKGRAPPFKSRYTNIGKLLFDSMKNNLNLVGQVDPITEIEDTFGDMLDSSIKCALWMQKQGVGYNDVIVISSQVNRECFFPCIAALFIGAIFNPWDDQRDTDTYSRYIKLVQPKVIFVNEKSAPIVMEAVKIMDDQIKVVSFGDYPGTTPFADTLKGHSIPTVTNFQCSEINPEIAIIMFTSGTTSFPKGIPFIHRSLLTYLELWEGPPVNTWMWYSSLFWLSGPICSMRNIILGRKQIIAPPFEEESACKIIEKYKIKWLLLTTGSVNRLVRYNRFHEYDFSHLKTLYFGGSSMDSEAQDYVKKCFPNTTVMQAYGLTEFCSLLSMQLKNSISGSCGFPYRNCEIKIIDPETGEALGPYQNGEICGKSVSMMPGYYKNPEATKKTIDKDGWLHTGDLGYYNENGELFAVDRMSELIKFRDHTVIPSEIEAVVLSHPSVLEVGVIGMPHPVDGEHPIAFVSKIPNREVSSDDLINFVANEVKDHCRLRGGVIFLPSLPCTSTGKIWKKKLKELLKGMTVS